MCNIVYTINVGDLRIRDVPEITRKAFKLACVRKDISMNKMVIRLIEEFLRKESEPIGKDE